jgi:uncharacterized protein involved in exopolysaccharide biosynthesis
MGVLSRRRGLIALCLVPTFLGVVAGALRNGDQYQAEMEVLVRPARSRTMVAADSGTPRVALTFGSVTPEEVNSEATLLQGRDLMSLIVQRCGLATPGVSLGPHWPGNAESDEVRRDKAIQWLGENLKAEQLPNSNLVRATFVSKDPGLCSRVLRTLAELYFAKHLVVQKPDGAVEFFEQQADRYRQTLAQAEARLAVFSREGQTAEPGLERDLLVRTLDEAVVANSRTRLASAASPELPRE